MSWFREIVGDGDVQLTAYAVIGIIICWRIHKWVDRNWLGNAGDHAKCIVCGRDCSKYIPVIGLAMSNPLRVRPRSPRVMYDFTNPNRICPEHQVERLGKLHRKVSHFRTEVLDFSGTKYAMMVNEDRAALADLGKPEATPEPPKVSQPSSPSVAAGWPAQ